MFFLLLAFLNSAQVLAGELKGDVRGLSPTQKQASLQLLESTRRLLPPALLQSLRNMDSQGIFVGFDGQKNLPLPVCPETFSQREFQRPGRFPYSTFRRVDSKIFLHGGFRTQLDPRTAARY